MKRLIIVVLSVVPLLGIAGYAAASSDRSAAAEAASATAAFHDLEKAQDAGYVVHVAELSGATCIAHGAEGAERIACVLTGHGLKDPQTALAHAGSVVPCEPDIEAVENAIG